MKLTGNTILVTGGATGIGLAITERFYKAGSKVIVCGRRADKLKEVEQKYPGVQTIVSDVGSEADRIALFNLISKNYPNLNVLVNNAGIQQRVNLNDNQQEWRYYQKELAINLEAPIHLSLLFIPLLKKQANPKIINVTSGLAFAPGAFAPIYSATKAALHSFTLSLRHQLASTPIKVIEIVPPAVNTDLGGPGLHTFGVNVNEFADGVIGRIAEGELEVGYGTSEVGRKASREQLTEMFNRINSMH